MLGGGNSAGQAAVFLAGHARRVRVLVRGPSLSQTMSRYLIDRLAASFNVEVMCDTEAVELSGTPEQGLQRVRWRNRRTGAKEQRAISHLFVFTGADVSSPDRALLPMETGVAGIFAIGDVRSGSVKRVGAAVGEGAAVVAQLHAFLARRASRSADSAGARHHGDARA